MITYGQTYEAWTNTAMPSKTTARMTRGLPQTGRRLVRVTCGCHRTARGPSQLGRRLPRMTRGHPRMACWPPRTTHSLEWMTHSGLQAVFGPLEPVNGCDSWPQRPFS